MPITLDACVATNIGDRAEQQDRAGLFQHPKQKTMVLAVVADGVGGTTGGAQAAGQVVLSMKNNFETFSPNEQPPAKMLKDGLNEAHNMIRHGRVLNEQDPNSTGVILLLRGQGESMVADWAHTGDSRLYHMRGNKVLTHTTDHTYVQQMIQKGYMTPEQAAVHPRRNVLVTSLGGEDAPLIDIGTATDLAGGDNFLICSDGLYAYFSETELAATIAANSARQASEKLMALARQRANGKGDNCTLIILKIEAVDPPPAPPGKVPPPPPAGNPPLPQGGKPPMPQGGLPPTGKPPGR